MADKIRLRKGLKFRPRQKKAGTYDARSNDRTLEVISGRVNTFGQVSVRSINHALGHQKVVQIKASRLLSSEYTLVFSPCPETAEGTQDACPMPPARQPELPVCPA